MSAPPGVRAARGLRLAHFFDPASIAIVGASEEGMYPAGILKNLLSCGYAGRLFPVNPKRSEIFGLACYPTLAALPERPDLILVIVPRQAVLGVVEEAERLGVPAAVVISAGFAESDAEGKQLEAALRARLQESRIAVIGPNCAGFASLANAVIATRLSAPARAGGVGFVSASGALMMAMQGLFADAGLGLSRIVSLGNQVDVSLTDVLEFLVDDPQTQVIGAFIEGMDDGRRFARVAARAHAAGKPLVLLKSGRSQAGQAAAATHTAALATSQRVFEAVCRQAGAILVDDIAELTATLHACVAWRQRMPAGRRVALVTQSGGMGSLAADWASAEGLALPPLPPALQEQTQGVLAPNGAPALKGVPALGNPADVRGAGALGQVAADLLQLFLESPAYDAALLLLAKSAVAPRELATAQALAQLAATAPKPFALVWVGQRAPQLPTDSAEPLRLLAEASIPLFSQPRDALRTLARLAAWGEQRVPAPQDSAPPPLHAGSGARRQLAYAEIVELLARVDIAPIAALEAADAEGAATAARQLGLPVALKGISARHSHKSDAGLVRVGLASAEAVRAVAGGWLADPELGVKGLLVQRMAPPGVEVLLGVETDAQFGPLLVAGPGGVLVELLNQTALRPLPLSPADAEAMLGETALARLLGGLRGAPAADAGALTALMGSLGRLAARTPALRSLDMNPVIVHAQGLSIVDLRVEWEEEG